MRANRLVDYLDHMTEAATDACTFVEGSTGNLLLRTSEHSRR